MPVVNFTIPGREPLTGTFLATVTAMKYGLSANNEPKFDVEFTLDDPEVEGRRAWIHPSLQPQALWRTNPTLVAMGYPANNLYGPLDTDDVIAKCMGQQCRLVLSEGTYNGQPWQNVDEVLSLYDTL